MGVDNKVQWGDSVFHNKKIIDLPIETVVWDGGLSTRVFCRHGWQESPEDVTRMERYPEEWGGLTDHHKITYRDPDQTKVVLKFEHAIAEYTFPEHGEPMFVVSELFTRSGLGIIWRGE